jgi:hypothetical protein
MSPEDYEKDVFWRFVKFFIPFSIVVIAFAVAVYCGAYTC